MVSAGNKTRRLFVGQTYHKNDSSLSSSLSSSSKDLGKTFWNIRHRPSDCLQDERNSLKK